MQTHPISRTSPRPNSSVSGNQRTLERKKIQSSESSLVEVSFKEHKDVSSLGFNTIVAAALGPVDLPPPLKLISALEIAADQVGQVDSTVPGLSDLVRNVLAEEIAKLGRYVDMSGR